MRFPKILLLLSSLIFWLNLQNSSNALAPCEKSKSELNSTHTKKELENPRNKKLLIKKTRKKKIISKPKLTKHTNRDKVNYNILANKIATDYHLQKVVNSLLECVSKKGFSTEHLSISIIDLNRNSNAGYQQHILRYPASVVKLFFLVALYSQISYGMWENSEGFLDDIQRMIKYSDNSATSRIVDALTNSKSGPTIIDNEKYINWVNKRYWISRFFINAGYKNIHLSQKTYPIFAENRLAPEGRDLQIRNFKDRPTRNKVSTWQAAKLLSDIVNKKTISKDYSNVILDILKWELKSKNEIIKRSEKYNIFNPITGFLGDNLPDDIVFASKAGSTSFSRQEVAFISTDNGKTKYILSVFSEDKSFANNTKIFPYISNFIFSEMTNNMRQNDN